MISDELAYQGAGVGARFFYKNTLDSYSLLE